MCTVQYQAVLTASVAAIMITIQIFITKIITMLVFSIRKGNAFIYIFATMVNVSRSR